MHIQDKLKSVWGIYMKTKKNITHKNARVCSDVLWKKILKIPSFFYGRETNPFSNPKTTRGCHRTLLQSLNGSITVEASLITPIFFIVIFSLFYILQILFGMQQIQGQLRNAAREYACYGTKFQTAQTFIKEKKLICWSGKSEGDGLKDNEICFVDYKIKVPFLGEKIFSVHLYQQLAVSKFEGKSMVPEEGTDDEEYVYITLTGRVCHKSIDCTYLKPSIRTVLSTEAVNKRNASGGKYYACESCCKGKTVNDFQYVFITSYGECFHCTKTCKGLKRTVKKVRRSETGMPYCNKCE